MLPPKAKEHSNMLYTANERQTFEAEASPLLRARPSSMSMRDNVSAESCEGCNAFLALKKLSPAF